MSDLYSKEAEHKRKQFNRIINGIDMVLMNNIPEVDESVWENWTDKSPMAVCEIEDGECEYHGEKLDEDGECPYQDEMPEIYQWFAVNSNDADFLASHNQYITYSDLLDTHFLAITHFGTAWDYTQMVDDFNDLYLPLEEDTK
jgi:hypothetical protein